MIDFNRPAFTGREFDYIRDASISQGIQTNIGIETAFEVG